MNSRERVFAALRFEEPDRAPRFIWLGGEVSKRLCEKYAVGPHEINRRIGNDVLQTWVSINGEMERDVPEGTEFTDGFGIVWKRTGPYNNVVRHPLAGLTADEIRRWSPPDPHRCERYGQLEALVESYGAECFIGSDVSGVLFEPACHLRGMGEMMLDMAEEREEAELILDKLADFAIAVSIESLKRGADWIWTGDDLGSQQGMLISPAMWRRFIKPRLKRIIDAIREFSPGVPVAYHSCGSMAPVIPDLIEAGVSVLNPVQESAAGMDQAAIKSKFGNVLGLMCGLDTQTFMREASPDEVYAATVDKVKSLGRGGGYIFAVSHSLQGDVPDGNIEAMLRALTGSVI